jgi:DNA-binding transcriptional MerR regulator
MLHQLDLFGGEPVKLEGKPVHIPKKNSKAPKENSSSSQTETISTVSEATPVNVYNQADLFSEVDTPLQTQTPVTNNTLPDITKKEDPDPVPPKEQINEHKETTQKPVVNSPTIPSDEILFSKQYHPISEVAIMFGVNISLLRYWEKEFDIIKPRKNRKGDRLFRPADIKNLKLIYHLLKEKKYTIKGAKDFLKKGNKVSEKFESVEVLKNIRVMLLELKSALN